MTRKKITFHKSSIIKKRDRRPKWPRLKNIYAHEMKPILSALEDVNIPLDVKACLRNYLIITLVSTMENYLRAVAIRNIDDRNVDISKVVGGEITIPLTAFDSITRHQLTKGSLVASNFSFARPNQINDFFSKTLNLDFFALIKELDRLDPYNYFHYAASLNRNWIKFMEMFDLRDRLVHEKKPITLYAKQLTSLSATVP